MRSSATLILIGLVACIFPVRAQDDNDVQHLFDKGYYATAFKYYSELLKKDSSDADLNYKIGICFMNSRSQKAKAIKYFERSIVFGKKPIPAQTYKLLADAFYSVSDFDSAAVNYGKYRKLTEGNSTEAVPLGEIGAKMELCKVSKELKELKGSVAYFEMNKAMSKGKSNSLVIDHPAAHNSLSSVGKAKSEKKEVFIPDRDFYESKPDATPIFDPKERKWDTSTVLMETTVGTSVDGQIILVYRNDNGEGNLYTAVLNGNEWKGLEKLNRTINNKSWEKNEFVSADGNSLYFSSDREGGYGGKDLYKCMKQNDGEWSKAENMGPNINSRFDEEAPFMHPDAVTLYFSSNRNRSNGYFDNFKTVFADSGAWTLPINVGYPLYKPKEENKKIKTDDGKENYIVTFNNPKGTSVTIIKRKIKDLSGKIPSYMEVIVANNETGTLNGIYHPDPNTGEFSCIVPSEKNNNITYEAEGYMFYSENINVQKEQNFYKLEKTVELVPVEVGSKVTLNNVFFVDKSASIANSSHMELNRISKFLLANPKIKTEISTQLDPKSSYEEIKLAGDRLRSVINYFSEKGIEKEKVESRVYLHPKKKRRKKNTITEYGKVRMEILTVK
jgi:tetratricopeptide (TPR) repeat protein/outer membrane protein OmpA-like peptidoglycan-associated protein